MNKQTPQEINIVMKIHLEESSAGKVTAAIPKELRLTEDAFNFILRMIQEQGFELERLNIAAVHTEEIKKLPNVNLEESKE